MSRGFTRFSGPGLALGSMTSSQLGAAIAVPVMLAHGSFGITAMRLASAAAILVLFARPRLGGFSRRQWAGAIALGLAMAVLTGAYFEAVSRIPVGPAITIGFLGPLAVAVASLKGWTKLILPLLAASGVIAMTFSRAGWQFDPAGMLCALAAACGWGAYIVLLRHVGRLFSQLDGLCLSFAVAALVMLFLVWVGAPSELSFAQLPAAAGLSLLSPLIPFSFEMVALRRMNIGAFSIMMSLEPAIGTVLGFIILDQRLSVQQLLGVSAVMMASIGAVFFGAGKQPDGGVERRSPERAGVVCEMP